MSDLLIRDVLIEKAPIRVVVKSNFCFVMDGFVAKIDEEDGNNYTFPISSNLIVRPVYKNEFKYGFDTYFLELNSKNYNEGKIYNHIEKNEHYFKKRNLWYKVVDFLKDDKNMENNSSYVGYWIRKMHFDIIK